MKQLSMHQWSLRTPAIITLLFAASLYAAGLSSARAEQASSSPSTSSANPASETRTFSYNVWLDSRDMGTHRYTTVRNGDDLQVTSTADFIVKVVFVTVFNYQHTANERWHGNCLVAVNSTTQTNGEEQELELEMPAGSCEGTYTYWDKTRLQRSTLLNAQTGEIEPASWQKSAQLALPTLAGKKTLQLTPDIREAIQRSTLKTASANFHLWYDKADNLLVMQTQTDGRTVTYAREDLRFR